MPPSKIRKNLVGLTNLAPQIEDVLLEKVDQPLCTYLFIQKSKAVTKIIHSWRLSSIEMEILTDLLIVTATSLLQKEATSLRGNIENLRSWEIFFLPSIPNCTMEVEVWVASTSSRVKIQLNSVVVSLPKRVCLIWYRSGGEWGIRRQLG